MRREVDVEPAKVAPGLTSIVIDAANVKIGADATGIGMYLQNLHEGLRELPAVRVHLVNGRRRGGIRSVLRRVWSILVSNALYLSSGNSVVLVGNIQVVLFRPRRCVAVFYDTIPIDHPSPGRRLYDWFAAWGLRTMAKNCDIALCISRHTERRVLAHFPWLASRVVCVAPPVAFEAMAIRQRMAAARAPVDSLLGHTPFVLMLGMLTPRKGIGAALEAFHSTGAGAEGRAKFALAGPLGEAAEEILEKLSGTPGAEYLGYVAPAVRDWLLCNCLGLVFNSEVEGFGMPLVEAAQFGTPLVVRRTAASLELAALIPMRLVSDEAELRQAVEELLRSPSTRNAVDENALRPYMVSHVASTVLSLATRLTQGLPTTERAPGPA